MNIEDERRTERAFPPAAQGTRCTRRPFASKVACQCPALRCSMFAVGCACTLSFLTAAVLCPALLTSCVSQLSALATEYPLVRTSHPTLCSSSPCLSRLYARILSAGSRSAPPSCGSLSLLFSIPPCVFIERPRLDILVHFRHRPRATGMGTYRRPPDERRASEHTLHVS